MTRKTPASGSTVEAETARHRRGGRTARVAAIAAALVLLWLIAFQVMLAAGVPLGRLAWGGHDSVLPPGLRIASLVAAAVLLGALWLVAQRAGWVPAVVPRLRFLLAGLSVLFALSMLLNLLGASGWERVHGGVVAMALMFAFGVLASP
jgi:hypothetical protein